jgi:hypothetical protein
MDREQTTEKLRDWTFDPFEYELYDLQQLVRPSVRRSARAVGCCASAS